MHGVRSRSLRSYASTYPEKDGYEAVQLGFGERSEKNTSEAMQGHLAVGWLSPKRHLVEFKSFNRRA